MAWTPTVNVSTGSVLTATDYNQQVLGNLNDLRDRDGLVYIAKATLSAATTLNVNNCFSSSYENYRIIATGGVTSVATGGNVTMRMRASGTDNTTASAYNYYGLETGSTYAPISSAETSFFVGFGGFNTANSRWGSLCIDVLNPFGAQWTTIQAVGLGVTSGGAERGTLIAGSHRVATSYDGFTLFYPQSITLTVRVYGYNNG